MKVNHDTDDERELRQLFDATAAEASGPTLTRMSARAAEVPERASRAPRWLPRWAWAPSLGGLAVAAAALAVTFGPWFTEPASSDGQGPVGAVAAAPVPVPLPQLASPKTGEPSSNRGAPGHAPAELDELEDPSAASLAEVGWDTSAEGDLDLLSEPPDGEDLDAWLYATAELLEGT